MQVRGLPITLMGFSHPLTRCTSESRPCFRSEGRTKGIPVRFHFQCLFVLLPALFAWAKSKGRVSGAVSMKETGGPLHGVARSFMNAVCRMLWTVRKKVDPFYSASLYHGGIVLPGHVRLRERRDGVGAAIDRAGMALSLSCGLHCTFTPLLIGLAASLPIGWLLDESTEVLLLAAAVLTGALSLAPSYWRRHRRKRCLAMFAAGAGLLAIACISHHAARRSAREGRQDEARAAWRAQAYLTVHRARQASATKSWRSYRVLRPSGGVKCRLTKLGPVGERWEPWTVASGAALLATAHLVNLRLCRQCARCEAEEPFA